ncbi:MAG TPA: RsmG family class I SAM-dependent methyltransferase, partial [Myxococcaceae bacterium]|nr:RsmG family class I SAM-dependent methyltransferase [Myxococcaceae bacterium]
EKHFLDSLAVLPEVEGAGSVLDVGAGAGFPGLPLKMARPSLAVTMVDAVGKKVGYLKAVGEDELRAQAGKRNLKVVSARAYRLPFSGAERQVASFAKAE